MKHPEEYARSAEECLQQAKEHSTEEIRQTNLTEAAVWAQLAQAAAAVYAADRREANQRS
ncbi:hypothetical protein MOQ72_19970 [Saccharopolyspora sp. K220]|uniref:hypothetical protein n=1 Tax=Saccharopolyspora soli TaxID=2926618 RepID=UPI001F55E98E|nr:hypothetical protein [Saccharopolyspora soli]MCI2419727.1 hypothetical protein [Saccharopolyspora soli]